MNVDRDKDDDIGGFVGQLVEAGLVEAYVRADGKTAYRLTEEGERVGRLLEAAEENNGLPANTGPEETQSD